METYRFEFEYEGIQYKAKTWRTPSTNTGQTVIIEVADIQPDPIFRPETMMFFADSKNKIHTISAENFPLEFRTAVYEALKKCYASHDVSMY